MSIRPVDLLSLLPRTMESTRAQGVQEGAAQAFQQALANEGRAHLEQKGSQVQATGEGESTKLRAGDEERQGANGGARRERSARSMQPKEAAAPKGEEARPPGVGSRLDLKL